MSLQKIIFRSAIVGGVAALISVQASAQSYSTTSMPMDNSVTAYPVPSGPQNQPAPSTAVPGQYTSSGANNSYNGDAPATAQPTYQPNTYAQTQQYQNSSSVTSYTSGPIYHSVTDTDSSYSDLPRYSYDPRLDPRQNPTPKPKPAPEIDESQSRSGHPYMSLETQSGIDVTAQLAYYDYKEPDFGVENDGPIFGLNVAGTLTFRKFFGTIEARYAYASTDYSGSGTASGEPTDSLEFRALLGRDFVAQTFSVSPYAGIGYRTLANDARGFSSTGAAGYRRYNQLYYIPVGIHPRTHIDSESRVNSTLEFDYVIHGLQKSDLADAGLGDPNVKNAQSSGFGLRADFMYETKTGWSFGPYFTYWQISASKVKNVLDNGTSCGSPPCVASFIEPFNDTIEAGVQVKYHFF